MHSGVVLQIRDKEKKLDLAEAANEVTVIDGFVKLLDGPTSRTSRSEQESHG